MTDSPFLYLLQYGEFDFSEQQIAPTFDIDVLTAYQTDFTRPEGEIVILSG